MINSIEDISHLLLNSKLENWLADEGNVDAIIQDDLILFNYNREATFANTWNWFERQARGLIFDLNTGECVARPFEKFFNWGEYGKFNNSGIYKITEKIDGSLGIGFFHKGYFRVVTRGSFTSPQSIWATYWLRDRMNSELLMGKYQYYTYLFEIIYPENQIVVDYGTERKCVLLDVRDNQTGNYKTTLYVENAFNVDSVKQHTDIDSLNDLLDVCDGMQNQEGFVVEFQDGERMKFKSNWYLERHHLFTSRCSKKQVFEAIRQGLYDDYRSKFDGPKAELIDMWEKSIREEFRKIQFEVAQASSEIAAYLITKHNRTFSQKEYAEEVNKNYKKYSSLLFLYHTYKLRDENIFKYMENHYDLSG